jgi:hypothetical protein
MPRRWEPFARWLIFLPVIEEAQELRVSPTYYLRHKLQRIAPTR